MSQATRTPGLGACVTRAMAGSMVPTTVLWIWHGVLGAGHLLTLVTLLAAVWGGAAVAIWATAGVRWIALWAVLLVVLVWPSLLVVSLVYAVVAAQIVLSMAPSLPTGSASVWMQWVLVGPGLPMSAVHTAVTGAVAAVAFFAQRRPTDL